MKLLEYEAKALLSQSGVPVPKSQLLRPQSNKIIQNYPIVLKAQVPVGGRGKAGGIRVVESANEYQKNFNELLSLPISGHVAKSLLAEEKLTIAREYYLAITIDRTEQKVVLLAHNQGGVDIESATSSIKRFQLQYNPPSTEIVNKLTTYFKLDPVLQPKLSQLVSNLWKAFISNDALLLEINPLVLTKNNKLVCADAKIELDSAASFRHSDWHFEQPATSSQFVVLNPHGTVASMANGAGLAMATVDAIQTAGAVPANFLDIGGGTNTEGMVDALKSITRLPSVNAIVVNIFAGITRCDEVAEALVIAKQQFSNLPPLFIRLAGTNQQKGEEILKNSNIATLPTLQQCVQGAIQKVQA